MNPYTQLVSRVLFPLHERLKHHDSVRRRKQLEASQWLSSKALKELQNSKLRAFIKDIYQHIPYYQNLFNESGLAVDDIQTTKDLQKLPFLDKALIRQHQEELKADDAKELRRYNTGGSSGEPLVFYIGRGRVSHDVAAKWRATRWWDVDIGDRELVIWGSPVELGSQDRIRLVRDKLMRSELIPAFEMSETKLDSFIKQIRDYRPKMLFGYPSSLSLIAKHARKRGQDLSQLGIKVAFVTSERLYDDQREIISTTFACPVANGYGGRDAGFIAHQCPAGSLHISAEDIIVELIDPQGRPVPAGTAGEIVVTHLSTRDYPFVRYRTGDIATLAEAPCACGRGLPSLAEIQGRSTDFVTAADGTLMHGLALIYIVRELEGLESFKIEQISIDETHVYLVTNDNWEPQCEQTIRNEFQRRLGPKVNIEIHHVEQIAAEKSGKFRYVVSHVSAA